MNRTEERKTDTHYFVVPKFVHEYGYFLSWEIDLQQRVNAQIGKQQKARKERKMYSRRETEKKKMDPKTHVHVFFLKVYCRL